MLNSNMLSAGVELRVLRQGYDALIVVIDHYGSGNLLRRIELVKKIT